VPGLRHAAASPSMSSSGGRLPVAPSAPDSQSADSSLDYEALTSSLQREAPELRDHFGDRLENWNKTMANTTMTAPPVTGSSGTTVTANVGSDVRHTLTIEELCFTSALSCFEGYLKLDSGIGPKTMAHVTKLVTRTLEKTHHLKDVRYVVQAAVTPW